MFVLCCFLVAMQNYLKINRIGKKMKKTYDESDMYQ